MKGKNVITRAVGHKDYVEVDTREIEVQRRRSLPALLRRAARLPAGRRARARRVAERARRVAARSFVEMANERGGTRQHHGRASSSSTDCNSEVRAASASISTARSSTPPPTFAPRWCTRCAAVPPADVRARRARARLRRPRPAARGVLRARAPGAASGRRRRGAAPLHRRVSRLLSRAPARRGRGRSPAWPRRWQWLNHCATAGLRTAVATTKRTLHRGARARRARAGAALRSRSSAPRSRCRTSRRPICCSPARARLGRDAERGLMVGDTERDVLAGRAAGHAHLRRHLRRARRRGADAARARLPRRSLRRCLAAARRLSDACIAR